MAGPRGPLSRFVNAALVVLLPTTGLVGLVSAPANASLRDRFSREVVRPGAVDRNPYDIEHVYELQYRLHWLGLLRATPNGHFGPKTLAAVKQFQKRNGVPVTGVVRYRTWRPLIQQTVRGRRLVPRACKRAGWHACYDRRRHQVNLYRAGVLLNSWLVRGGSAGTPTRVGSFVVYWRDIDHVSSTYGNAPMPYAQFFSGGQALHGSRLMMDPFVGHSHGCVNFWTEDARQLWNLTSTRTLHVHVYGRWD
ncbi:MAG: L,D-transpeptidase family protein [Actinomycetes bacterium]